MKKEELEKQYSPSKWSSRHSADNIIPQYINFAEEAHQLTLKEVPSALDIHYCSTKSESQRMDFFGTDLPKDCPILVCVHGGYWQELNKEVFSIPAKQMHKSGIASLIVGYTLAPKATLHEIIEEIYQAIDYACKMAEERQSKGVFLMGWSAGAHLILQVISTKKGSKNCRWQRLKGVISISGIFDLRPLVDTYINEPLHLKGETALELSPINYTESFAKSHTDIKLLIAFGGDESPEFKRQSLEYYQKLLSEGLKSVVLEEVPDVDHFNIIENLFKEEFPLKKAMANLILNNN